MAKKTVIDIKNNQVSGDLSIAPTEISSTEFEIEVHKKFTKVELDENGYEKSKIVNVDLGEYKKLDETYYEVIGSKQKKVRVRRLTTPADIEKAIKIIAPIISLSNEKGNQDAKLMVETGTMLMLKNELLELMKLSTDLTLDEFEFIPNTSSAKMNEYLNFFVKNNIEIVEQAMVFLAQVGQAKI